MTDLTMGFENIITTNGIAISIVGIVIVFAALSVIALFIAMLPKLMSLTVKLFPEVEHPHAATPSVDNSSDHDAVLAAIAYALFRKQTQTLPAK